MGKSGGKMSWRNFFLGVVVFAVFVVCGIGTAFYDRALIGWWVVPSVSLAFALLLSLTLWRLWPGLTGSRRFVWNYCLSVAVIGSCFYLGIFLANDLATSSREVQVKKCRIERKYTTRHYHSRRVGRGRYTRGEAYYRYHVDVRLPDGMEKDFTVTLDRYNRVRQGSEVSLPLRRGLFGIWICERTSSPL